MTNVISEQLELDLGDAPVESELAAKLPKPVGYRLLIELPKVEETYVGSSIIKTSKELTHDHILTIVGKVIGMGGEVYSDKDRFPNGPWCKMGDYVIFRMNTGTRFTVEGDEYRLMNDDSIEAVVEDPSGIARAQQEKT